MAFVIVSTGALTGSRLHTVRAGTLLAGALLAAVALLAGGAALGFRIAQDTLAAANGAARVAAGALDPALPDQRVIIERVGAISGRLMRLEGEALRLAQRLGLAPAAASPKHEPAADAVTGPSGGPLVLPLSTPPAERAADFTRDLTRLSQELERAEANLALLAEMTALRDLDSMAFPSRAPINGGRISSGFGNRRDPFTRRLARHTGVDLPAVHGAPIYASAGGRVRLAGYKGAYGRTVEIDHGNGLVTRYGHASRLYVRQGDVVLPGQKIAAVGSSGRSTGPHLHFEVLRHGRAVEPRAYLARNET
jgi:murein DD-endopeptidase MepM/ murein hydrolase activator NlpD